MSPKAKQVGDCRVQRARGVPPLICQLKEQNQWNANQSEDGGGGGGGQICCVLRNELGIVMSCWFKFVLVSKWPSMAEGIYDMHEMEECTLMMKLQLAKMSVYFCSLFLKCVAATHTYAHTHTHSRWVYWL